MNTKNETIVSAKMLEQMRQADVADDYQPVSRDLERHAKKLLGKRDIVSYRDDSKFKKKIMKLQNKLRESQRREAANNPIVKAQLAALEK